MLNNMIKVGSCECSKAELDLFSMPPTNTSMEQGTFEQHLPIGSMDGYGDVTFVIESGYEQYIDIGRTYLMVNAVVTGKDGKALEAGAKVVPVNNWMHSLFSQVDVSLQNTVITSSLNTYPWKAYLENLLSFSTDAKDSHGSSYLWYTDTGDMNENDPVVDDPTNTGMKARGVLIAKSTPVEMVGRLHCDIFQQNRYLPPGVDMTVKLTRSSPALHLVAEGNDYVTKITRMALFVRTVTLNPSISVEHHRLLNGGDMMKYPIRRSQVTTLTLQRGISSEVKDNILTGQLPRRIVVGLISNTAFSGNVTENPFNFQTFDLNYLSLKRDSIAIPSKALTPNYEGGQYIRSYLSLLEGTGILNTDKGNGISREAYAKGFTLYAFDLTADMAEGGHLDPIKHGKISMELHFAKQLPVSVNVLIYAEYDNVIQIDRSKNVVTDYM